MKRASVVGLNQSEIVPREEACRWTGRIRTGMATSRSDRSRVSASWSSSCSLSKLSRIFLLTAVVAVDKLIAITLGLADLVALLAVVETGVILILMVSRRRWGRFRWARDGNVASRAYATTSDRSARSVVIVRCAVLSVLWSVLVFLGSTVSRVVVLGWENIVGATAASLGWYSRVAAVLTGLGEKSTAISAVVISSCLQKIYFYKYSLLIFFIF